MTSFDGLLPPRMPAPPLPERGGPASIVGAAGVRRRRKTHRMAGATSALSLAIVGLVAIRPAPADHGIKMRPDATPTAEPSRTSSPRPSGPAVGGVGPTDLTSPGPGTPLPTPTVRPTPSAPAPTIGPDPSPPAWLQRVARVDRTTVPDDLGRECFVLAGTTEPNKSFCYRYTGPAEAASGRPTLLTYEFCSRVADMTLQFRYAGEVRVMLTTQGSTEMWNSFPPLVIEPHDVLLPLGSCLRYAVHWDGTDNAGKPAPRGTYQIDGWLLAHQNAEVGATSAAYTLTVT